MIYFLNIINSVFFSRCEVVLRNAYIGKAQLCVQLRFHPAVAG